jgi:hypothetical protein
VTYVTVRRIPRIGVKAMLAGSGAGYGLRCLDTPA